MASRLMLSLKKAAAESTGPRFTTTMISPSEGRVPENGTLLFASQALDGPHETPETPTLLNEEDIELEFTPGFPRNSGSRQSCQFR